MQTFEPIQQFTIAVELLRRLTAGDPEFAGPGDDRAYTGVDCRDGHIAHVVDRTASGEHFPGAAATEVPEHQVDRHGLPGDSGDLAIAVVTEEATRGGNGNRHRGTGVHQMHPDRGAWAGCLDESSLDREGPDSGEQVPAGHGPVHPQGREINL